MQQPKRTWTKKIRPVRIEGDVAYLALKDGREAIVDIADLPLVVGRNWSADPHGYSRSGLGHLGRVILGVPAGVLVDHCDRNPLNNRRANLRAATSSQNCQNRRKSSGKSSSFKGVSFRSDRGTWLASIRAGGRLIKLGTFATEVEAAKAYDVAALSHFGEFAVLNFAQAAA